MEMENGIGMERRQSDRHIGTHSEFGEVGSARSYRPVV